MKRDVTLTGLGMEISRRSGYRMSSPLNAKVDYFPRKDILRKLVGSARVYSHEDGGEAISSEDLSHALM